MTDHNNRSLIPYVEPPILNAMDQAIIVHGTSAEAMAAIRDAIVRSMNVPQTVFDCSESNYSAARMAEQHFKGVQWRW